MTRYALGGGQFVRFAQDALAVLERHRQIEQASPEAGGQLFGTAGAHGLHVTVATEPRPTDRRGRYSFRPNRRAERRDILLMHALELSYLGDWHTHPESVPKPSSLDVESIGETARLSRNALGPLLLVIVGRLPVPEGLWVGLHDGERCRRAEVHAE